MLLYNLKSIQIIIRVIEPRRAAYCNSQSFNSINIVLASWYSEFDTERNESFSILYVQNMSEACRNFGLIVVK